MSCHGPHSTQMPRSSGGLGSCVYERDTLLLLEFFNLSPHHCKSLVVNRPRRLWDADPPASELVFQLQSSRLQIVQLCGAQDLSLRIDVAGQLTRAIDPRSSSYLDQLRKTQLAMSSAAIGCSQHCVTDVNHSFI